jgi:serine/threonine-protein kinase
MDPFRFCSPTTTASMRCAALFALALLSSGCSHPNGESAQKLFVTIPASRQLIIYKANAEGPAAPLQVITENPSDKPVDVSVDAEGEAFVANENANVRVYAPSGQKYALFKNYEGSNTRLQHPTAIAVNLAGSFFVADTGEGQGRLEWFSGGANGNLVPDRVVEGTETGINDPRGVAIDGSGRFFVADRTSNRVLVFDANAEGDARPIARLDGLHSPGRLAVDDVLDVYVANEGDNSISVFTSTGPESWSLGTTISNKALSRPSGVSIDATGEIAAGAGGGVLFFAPNAQGNAEPVRTLTSSDPLKPGGICIH